MLAYQRVMRMGSGDSIGWFKGKVTANSHMSWEHLWFPIDVPLSQPIGRYCHGRMGMWMHMGCYPAQHEHGQLDDPRSRYQPALRLVWRYWDMGMYQCHDYHV